MAIQRHVDPVGACRLDRCEFRRARDLSSEAASTVPAVFIVRVTLAMPAHAMVIEWTPAGGARERAADRCDTRSLVECDPCLTVRPVVARSGLRNVAACTDFFRGPAAPFARVA